MGRYMLRRRNKAVPGRPSNGKIYAEKEKKSSIRTPQQWEDIRHEEEVKQHPDAPAMGRYMLRRRKKAVPGRPSNGKIY
ncbi:hypothetical protein T01_8979, partial [Trichinella spiralis]